MKKALYILRRLAVLIAVALWFDTSTHVDLCHDDHEACDHSDSAACVCTCICHVPACVAQTEDSLPVEHHEIIRIPSGNEKNHALLLPNDIFRPPLSK